MKKVQLWNMIEIQCRQLNAQKRINKTLELAAKTAQDGADNAWNGVMALRSRVDRQEEHIRNMRQIEEALDLRWRDVTYRLEDVEDLRLMVYMSLAADAVLLFAVIYLLGK